MITINWGINQLEGSAGPVHSEPLGGMQKQGVEEEEEQQGGGARKACIVSVVVVAANQSCQGRSRNNSFAAAVCGTVWDCVGRGAPTHQNGTLGEPARQSKSLHHPLVKAPLHRERSPRDASAGEYLTAT